MVSSQAERCFVAASRSKGRAGGWLIMGGVLAVTDRGYRKLGGSERKTKTKTRPQGSSGEPRSMWFAKARGYKLERMKSRLQSMILVALIVLDLFLVLESLGKAETTTLQRTREATLSVDL